MPLGEISGFPHPHAVGSAPWAGIWSPWGEPHVKHTVRALLAVGLLLGVYVLAAVVVAAMGGLVYLAATAGSGAAAVKFGIVAVLVAVALGKGVVSSLRTPPLEEHGVALTPEAEPRLWSEVRALAGQVGVRAPDEIRLLPEVNAAVSEQSRWLGLMPGRRTMYIGAPLLIGLSVDQMRSVLAHELGHYSGRHTALAGVSYRGLEAIRRMIANLGPDSWVGRLFRLYGRLYLAVSHSVNRRQELEADRFSAEVAGRQSAIAAMRELPVIAQAWAFFIEAYASLGQVRGQRPEAMLAGFQQLYGHPERQGQLAQVRASEPDESRSVYDTHPSTAERIRAFAALPDDGRSDHSGPALELLESPGAAMADLERWMFEESALTGVSWDRLVSESGAATAARLRRRSPRLRRPERWRARRSVPSSRPSGRAARTHWWLRWSRTTRLPTSAVPQPPTSWARPLPRRWCRRVAPTTGSTGAARGSWSPAPAPSSTRGPSWTPLSPRRPVCRRSRRGWLRTTCRWTSGPSRPTARSRPAGRLPGPAEPDRHHQSRAGRSDRVLHTWRL